MCQDTETCHYGTPRDGTVEVGQKLPLFDINCVRKVQQKCRSDKMVHFEPWEDTREPKLQTPQAATPHNLTTTSSAKAAEKKNNAAIAKAVQIRGFDIFSELLRKAGEVTSESRVQSLESGD
nr:hypothetical protein Iba_chr10eCG8960 [Ipomoea batatas]